jgi:hypothetical protein
MRLSFLGMRIGERILPLLISLTVGIGIGVAVTVIHRGSAKEVSVVPAQLSILRQPPTPFAASCGGPRRDLANPSTSRHKSR